MNETRSAPEFYCGDRGWDRSSSVQELKSITILYAKIIEAKLRHARNDVQTVQGAEVGEIRVTASVAMGLLPRAVVAFQRARPRVAFRISEDVYPDMLPAIRSGDVDFAICLVPSRPKDETLSFVSLVKDHLVPAVRRLKLANLLDLDWIIYRRSQT